MQDADTDQEMTPMELSLISQFAADQQADLTVSATQRHLTRQACNIHRTAARPRALVTM
jgi:hypothetical protein